MKRLFNIISIIALGISIVVSSCTKNFDDINTNPNDPANAPNLSVLSYSIVELGDRFNISDELKHPASYAGHVVLGQNNDANNYMTLPPSGMWASYYVRSLKNLNDVIKTATEKEDNVKAAALVIKAYTTMIQVDAYGAAPYFEAAQLDEGVTNPSFDSEEAIYNNLLSILKEANGLFTSEGFNTDEKAMFRRYDILFGANKEFDAGIDAWKKFANSLRFRLAMRISNVDQSLASQVISEILNNPEEFPIIESNDDNATLTYPGTDGWVEPWTDRAGYYYIYMAAPIVDTLIQLNDPRIEKYAKKKAGQYIGLQVGAEGSGSGLSNRFVNNTENGQVFFLTYSEIEFLKAEAYARGFVSGDANTAYVAAITANMELLEVETDDINTYLAQPEVAFNDDLHKLYMQKWISLFRQSWEAWAEMRRTDVPILPVAVNTPYSGHNRVPFRFGYPENETQNNSAQITANVVDFYWGDQIWWDTRTGVQ